jgi:hypothetical protein
VANNRLIMLKSEDTGKQKGPGMESEYKRLTTFSPKV